MDLLQNKTEVPTRSTLIVWAEFVELTGCSPDRINELVEMGWLAPARTAEAILLFSQADVYRLRKLERLCADFELHTLGGSIVMDLLEKINVLEARIRELTKS